MASQGIAVGVGSAQGVGRAISNLGTGVGAAVGTGSASGAGHAIVRGVGAASGSGTAAAIGVAAGRGVGAALGAGTASGAGHAIVRGIGSASGAASAIGVGGPNPVTATILVLDPIGVPPFSGRGITMRLKPIQQSAQLVYDVNFNLVDISPPQARKFEVTLSCSDVEAPAFSALWPGMRVLLYSSEELGGPLSGPGPERPIVPGSYRTEFSFYYYRPILTCLVAGPWEQSFEEWRADRTWQLPLKEA